MSQGRSAPQTSVIAAAAATTTTTTTTMPMESNPTGAASDRPQSVVRHDKGSIIRSSSSNGDSSSCTDSDVDNSGIKFEDWGFQVERLFEVAYRFYKRNESKAFHPSFDERNQLIALILQARYGNFDGARAPDVGALDLVGKSRRQQWATMKGMSKTEAMSKFIFSLNEQCPLLKAHVEAVKISCDATSLNDIGPDSDDKKSVSQNETASVKHDEKLNAIYTSLCRQTYQQFKGYAMKQYPNDVQQQKYLISSLQEQYYQQYISKMHPELNNSSSSREQQLKSSLSPEASETSSSMHENGDDISTTSARTDQDLALASTKTSDQSSNSKDQPMMDSPQSTEVQTIANTSKDDSPIIGGKCNVTTSPFHVAAASSSKSVGPTAHDHTLSAEKPTAQAMHIINHKQVSKEVSCESIEYHELPKPIPYQPIDLQSIGKFESFPKPKPIPSNARPTTRPNELLQIIAPKKEIKKESPPAYTAIDFGDEPATTREEPMINVELSKPPTATLPPQELPPPPLQELPPPPLISEHESPAPSTTNDPQQMRCETSLSNDLNNQLAPNNKESCPIVISPENKPVVELWGYGDSSCDSNDNPLKRDSSVPYEPMEPATTWTKKASHEFKESLVDDKQGGIYVVKQGTLVTIQVPTYPDGRYIYWEFATEDYDIGFGLDFVHEANSRKPLAIEIFEETDEDNDDDDDDDDDEEASVTGNQVEQDVEAATAAKHLGQDHRSLARQKRAEKFARLANTVTVIPTYRRDSHEDIFIGRHKYPGRGYYLLKFDNTYSVLRSKTILFRICYFI